MDAECPARAARTSAVRRAGGGAPGTTVAAAGSSASGSSEPRPWAARSTGSSSRASTRRTETTERGNASNMNPMMRIGNANQLNSATAWTS